MIEKFWLKEKSSLSPPLIDLFKLEKIPPDLPLKELVGMAQKHFLRAPSKERWDLKDRWKQSLCRAKYKSLFHQLGLVDPILPNYKSYQSIVILGTASRDLYCRIAFAQSLDVKVEQIYLLSGKRALSPLENKHLKSMFTHIPEREDTLMEVLFQRLASPHQVPIHVVSEMKGTCRPTTKDTIVDWLRTDPKPGRHLLVSSQPFAYYQLLATKNILGVRQKDIQLDCAASISCVKKLRVRVYLDTIARVLYEINSCISV